MGFIQPASTRCGCTTYFAAHKVVYAGDLLHSHLKSPLLCFHRKRVIPACGITFLITPRFTFAVNEFEMTVAASSRPTDNQKRAAQEQWNPQKIHKCSGFRLSLGRNAYIGWPSTFRMGTSIQMLTFWLYRLFMQCSPNALKSANRKCCDGDTAFLQIRRLFVSFWKFFKVQNSTPL